MVDAINSVNSASVNPALTTGTQVSPQFQQKLLALGVPQATIAKGRDAVHAYIQANPNIQQALQAEKQQEQQQKLQQQSIYQPQQATQSQGAQSSQNGNHKAQLEAKAQQLMAQNPGMTEPQAIQQLIAQFKAQHPEPPQGQQQTQSAPTASKPSLSLVA